MIERDGSAAVAFRSVTIPSAYGSCHDDHNDDDDEQRDLHARFVTIRRSDLSRLIFAAIADDCEVMFGDGILAIDQEKDGVRVMLECGQTRRFDLLIGADDLHSTVRRLAFGPQEKYATQLGCTVAV